MPATLFTLPAVLLVHVCAHPSPRELLVTLALTAKGARDQLTSACFATTPLHIHHRELSLLAPAGPPTLTTRSFHARALSGCHIDA